MQELDPQVPLNVNNHTVQHPVGRTYHFQMNIHVYDSLQSVVLINDLLFILDDNLRKNHRPNRAL